MNLLRLPGNLRCLDLMVVPEHVMEGGWKFSIFEFVINRITSNSLSDHISSVYVIIEYWFTMDIIVCLVH